jgi:hypothetical protein
MKINGNLTFLGGGILENLRLEALANDPVAPLDNQVWVNGTDAKIRAKIGGNVVTLADDAALQQIINEVGAVELAVGLDAAGNFVAFTGTNYLKAATSVATSLTALDTQAKVTADAVAAEVTRATAAEGVLQSELNATQAGAGLQADGTLAAFTGANYVSSSATLRDAVVALDAQAKTGADAVAAEVTRATAAEGVLQTAVTAEQTRATGAETTLQSNINAEATRATGVEAGLNTRLTSVESSYINKDGSVALTGDLSAGSHKLTNIANPVNEGDAANKGYVDTKLATLGSVFEYVGVIEGGLDAEAAVDVGLLAKRTAGSYYKVTVGGYFKQGEGTAFYANATDGLLFNSADGVDIIDNTNSQVQGTTNFVTVTGNTDTGFVVDVADNFKTRVTTVETGLAAEITRATGAETTLQSNINAEATRAQAAEGVLQTNINTVATNLTAEVTRATGAEATLQSNIDAEAARATAAEGVLQTNITAETTRAKGVEAAIQAELDAAELAIGLNAAGTFTALTGTNFLNSATSVVGLSQALDSAVKALSDRYAGSFVVYNGSTPATSHTVTHNLGTQYANVTVVDTNNQVIIPQSITFDSTSALTVTFNSSIACKVIVSGLKA